MVPTAKSSLKLVSLRIPLHIVLVVPFVLQIVGSVGLVGYLSFRNGQTAVNNLAHQLMSELSDRIEQKLLNYLHTPREINQNNAAAIRLGILSWRYPTTLKLYFWQQMQIFDSINAVAITNQQKEFIAVEKREYGAFTIRIRDQKTKYDPWYRATKVAGKTIWRLVVSLAEVDKPVLMAVNFQPFYDRSNNFQGVLACSVYLSQLGKFLERLKIGKTGQAFIIEPNGLLIATSTGELPFLQHTADLDRSNNWKNIRKNLHRYRRRLSAVNSRNFLTHYTAQYLTQHFSSLSSIKDNQQLSFEIARQRYFVQVVPLQSDQDLNWLTVIVIPESDFMTQINTNVRVTILLCGATLLVSIGIVFFTTQGKVIGVNTFQDIRQRKAAEKVLAEYSRTLEEQVAERTEALRQSEELFRRAFDDAAIGMALIGLDEHWLKVNLVLCDLLGYSDLELLSMSVSSLVHPDDVEQLERCFEQMLSNESRNTQVALRYHCNGECIWVLLNLSLIQDAQSQPMYYVAQIQDITERQAIDQRKNEFISIVSHELRTPLTSIRGVLGLLATGIYDNKPQKAKRMIEIALTDSLRLVRLVNDILDLERLNSGIQLVMEACEVNNLMQQAVEAMQAIADEASVALSILPISSPDSPFNGENRGTRLSSQVWAAPDSILQTLTNLLSNAIKFSLPNSIVTLSAQPQFDFVMFQVKDQGRGIPKDKLEIIFGRFQQVDVSYSRQKGGTGLGLAICQSIVQQHGGKIWAESTVGEGSTFCFTLPTIGGKFST